MWQSGNLGWSVSMIERIPGSFDISHQTDRDVAGKVLPEEPAKHGF
jgi:hypothetical protein